MKQGIIQVTGEVTMIKDIRIVDNGDAFELRFSARNPRTGLVERRCYDLCGFTEEEECVKEALAYFGGMVRREDIKFLSNRAEY